MKTPFEKLRPDFIAPNVEAVNAISLQKVGLGALGAVIYDFDGTINYHHATYVENSVHESMQSIKQELGASLHIGSNAFGKRVDDLHKIFMFSPLDMDVRTPIDVTPAGSNPKRYRKPNPALFDHIAQEVEGPVLVVGDQQFKDILAANRADVYSVLVPRRGTGDALGVKLAQRPVEALIKLPLGLPLRRSDYPDELQAHSDRAKALEGEVRLDARN